MNFYVFSNPVSRESQNFLIGSFEQIGISLSADQVSKFMIYYDLLVEKNKVMNLTAITSFEDVVRKHFVDSVLLICRNSFYNLFSAGGSVIDVGSDAGFPGIPLKIIFPKLRIVLLDSLNKRVQFLNDVIETLQMDEITAVHFRAEDAAHNPAYRQKFDLCVSRAVANLSSLVEYCLPFVKQNGYFISYKSAKVDDEVLQAKKACYLLGGELVSIERICLPAIEEDKEKPETKIERSFVLIKKSETPPQNIPEKPEFLRRNLLAEIKKTDFGHSIPKSAFH